MNVTIADVSSMLALLGAAFAIFMAWRKAPAEIADLQAKSQQSTAEVILKYIDALGLSGEQVKGLAERVKCLEDITQAQEKELEGLRKENELLRNWAERLAHQVRSLGATPVAMMQPADTKPNKKRGSLDAPGI